MIQILRETQLKLDTFATENKRLKTQRDHAVHSKTELEASGRKKPNDNGKPERKPESGEEDDSASDSDGPGLDENTRKRVVSFGGQVFCHE